MANERQKRLMQEALDENLSSEARTEFYSHLSQDARDAAAFDRLKQVDHMLRSAPHERAPHRLAMSIMARLAETMSPQQLSRISGLALALGLSLVAGMMIPLLVAAGWLLLGAFGSAGALTTAIRTIVSILAVGIALLEAVIRQIQDFLSSHPELPVLMISLIPVSLFWLLRFVPRNRSANPT
jgi:anti-sigma factor RsiW